MKGAKLNAVCNSELTGKNTELCRHSGILLTRLCDMLQGVKTLPAKEKILCIL